MDKIGQLIKQAHALYPETLIYEVMDVGRDTAILRLSVYYGLPDMEKMERYFEILDQVRESEESKLKKGRAN